MAKVAVTVPRLEDPDPIQRHVSDVSFDVFRPTALGHRSGEIVWAAKPLKVARPVRLLWLVAGGVCTVGQWVANIPSPLGR